MQAKDGKFRVEVLCGYSVLILLKAWMRGVRVASRKGETIECTTTARATALPLDPKTHQGFDIFTIVYMNTFHA